MFCAAAAHWRRWIVVLDCRSKQLIEGSGVVTFMTQWKKMSDRLHQVCSPGGHAVYLTLSHILGLIDQLRHSTGDVAGGVPLIVSWSSSVPQHVDFHLFQGQDVMPGFKIPDAWLVHSTTQRATGACSAAASSRIVAQVVILTTE